MKRNTVLILNTLFFIPAIIALDVRVKNDSQELLFVQDMTYANKKDLKQIVAANSEIVIKSKLRDGISLIDAMQSGDLKEYAHLIDAQIRQSARKSIDFALLVIRQAPQSVMQELEKAKKEKGIKIGAITDISKVIKNYSFLQNPESWQIVQIILVDSASEQPIVITYSSTQHIQATQQAEYGGTLNRQVIRLMK